MFFTVICVIILVIFVGVVIMLINYQYEQRLTACQAAFEYTRAQCQVIVRP